MVYCDGCPKAFHLWCLDPPIQKIDESDSKWFCPACNIRKVRFALSHKTIFSCPHLPSRTRRKNPRPPLFLHSYTLSTPPYLLNTSSQVTFATSTRMVSSAIPLSDLLESHKESPNSVSTGDRGAYVDSSEIKHPRLKCVIIFHTVSAHR